MAEFFVWSNSFAAPFVSDTDTSYADGETPTDALEKFVASYRHPAGLYAARLFASADAYHKSAAPLAEWLCNHELAKQELTRQMTGYSYLGHAPGDFEINGERHVIDDPKGGRIVTPVVSES